jgi:predicted site-specific integrase-resolvase
MNIAYKTRAKASQFLGIHYTTLLKMAKRGEIETITVGKQTLYNVDKYIKDQHIEKPNKHKVCYCRVSSNKQKKDLDRQIACMKSKYPSHEIISDIGSGLNFKRIGLLKIIEYALAGELEVVVVAYKDRLARFGFELIEHIIKTCSRGTIQIDNKKEENTPTDELTKDIVAIMNVYVAKVNGLRKYKKMIKNEINTKN